MPLYQGAEDTIREMLTRLSAGERVSMTAIGHFTDVQFAEINKIRFNLGLHALEQNEILFVGRHVYNSRSKDGYTVEDIALQITSALCITSQTFISPKMTCMENPTGRLDGYGNTVNDRAVFELTARKPRAELFSVIPKGDNNKPINLKGPL